MSTGPAFKSIKSLFRMRDGEFPSAMLQKINPGLDFRSHTPRREVTLTQLPLCDRDRHRLQVFFREGIEMKLGMFH